MDKHLAPTYWEEYYWVLPRGKFLFWENENDIYTYFRGEAIGASFTDEPPEDELPDSTPEETITGLEEAIEAAKALNQEHTDQ